MPEETLAQPYAQALWEAAKETNATQIVAQDLVLLDKLLRAIPEFLLCLSHPRVDQSAKETVLASLKGRVHPYTLNLLRLLVRRGRAFLIPKLAPAYFKALEKGGGPVHVLVRTARPLSPADQEKLLAGLSEALGRAVTLEEEVAPELLAGAELVVFGQRLDASLRGRLARLRRALGG